MESENSTFVIDVFFSGKWKHSTFEFDVLFSGKWKHNSMLPWCWELKSKDNSLPQAFCHSDSSFSFKTHLLNNCF